MVVRPTGPLVAAAQSNQAPVLHLFGGPHVTLGQRRVEIPEGSKRLLVFVALHRRRVERRHAAGTLWPIGDDIRAAGNLRSALWRLRGAGIDLLAADKWSLALCDGVVVDVHVVGNWAARLVDGTASDDDLAVLPWWVDALDLLPGWYDDWALVERERMRQHVLHALEALSRRLVRAGRCAEAVEAAILAVGAEPLRESAQRVLIEAHFAEGNWVEGWRSYQRYRDLLCSELDVEPSADLTALLRTARHERSARSQALHLQAAPSWTKPAPRSRATWA
ncbi:MAG: AfsR/SARP family transcriptional regulator [Pseudonocardiaceae bacterium]